MRYGFHRNAITLDLIRFGTQGSKAWKRITWQSVAGTRFQAPFNLKNNLVNTDRHGGAN